MPTRNTEDPRQRPDYSIGVHYTIVKLHNLTFFEQQHKNTRHNVSVSTKGPEKTPCFC